MRGQTLCPDCAGTGTDRANRNCVRAYDDPGALYMPSRHEQVPFTQSLVLDGTGFRSFRAEHDMLLVEIGAMTDAPETRLDLEVRNPHRYSQTYFDTMHLSLLWPNLHRFPGQWSVSRDNELQLRAAPRTVVLLSGFLVHRFS